MRFVELPRFTRKAFTRLDDANFGELCAGLLDYPDLGDLIPQSGGLRRLPLTLWLKGKKIGVCTVYYCHARRDEIYLLGLFFEREKKHFTVREVTEVAKVFNPATKLAKGSLAREYADVRTGKVAPGRVWQVTKTKGGTVDRRQIPAEKYQLVQRVIHPDAPVLAMTVAPRAILPGQTKDEVASARRKLGVSQAVFAAMLGVSLTTLRSWEQGRRHPVGPAGRLLHLANHYPAVFKEAFGLSATGG